MTLHYISTRGQARELAFGDVLLEGLAGDGGLYVPETWPSLPSTPTRRPTYAAIATEVMWPFVEGQIDREAFERIVAESYATFTHPDVAPLVELDGGLWLMELFHGPTLAFKDIALQLLGRLFDHELARRGERVTIVGATSGDTGSAAIEACRDRESLDIFVLHPHGRVTEVQRRQMTTVPSSNVHNIAVEGSFDDCQDIVKAMFADESFRGRHRLAAVNSINFARVMAQIVYYVVAAQVLGRPVSFAVPTGNFGNVYAGYAALRMGLDVPQLVVGSNTNDILARFFASARLEIREVIPTMSPSMDIAVSSNLERLLFELNGRDGEATATLLRGFRATGAAELPAEVASGLQPLWAGARVGEDETLDVIGDVYRRTGRMIDPHSAVGVGAARACRRDADVPMVVLATAHPAKFPDAVQRACGRRPGLPAHLADLHERPERCTVLANDVAAVQRFVADRTRTGG
jgi:threonine synthase